MDGDGDADDDQRRTLERVEALLDMARHADAATAARTGLARHPDSALLHQRLAQAMIGLEDMPAALPHARAAASLEPDSPDALRLLAGTLAAVGDGARAREASLRAVHLAPDECLSHVVHAHALLFGVRGPEILGEAEAAARRAIELCPHEPGPHVVLGIARWRQDDVATAEEAFQHALLLDPADVDAQRNLASLQISLHRLETGARTLGRGLALHPQDRGMHAESDRARRQVLASVSFWFMTVAVLLGGFMLATDVLWRQRAGQPAVLLALLVAIGVKRAASLPGSKAPLLPWWAPAGQRVVTTLDWLCIALALAVFLAPDGPAGVAWAAVTAALVSRSVIFWLRVLRSDRPARRESATADRP